MERQTLTPLLAQGFREVLVLRTPQRACPPVRAGSVSRAPEPPFPGGGQSLHHCLAGAKWRGLSHDRTDLELRFLVYTWTSVAVIGVAGHLEAGERDFEIAWI